MRARLRNLLKCPYEKTVGELVDIGVVKLWTEWEGVGEPLYLLHGGPGNDHRAFHPVFSRLSPYFKVIYRDARGCGQSADPVDGSGFSPRADVDDLERLRRKLGHKKIRLFGGSAGVITAIQYAAQFPERVSHLVVSEGNYKYDWIVEAIGVNTHSDRAKPHLEKLGFTPDDLDDLNNQMIVMDRMQKAPPVVDETKPYLEMTEHPEVLEYHVRIHNAWMPFVRQLDLTSELSNLQMKTLLITGTYDPSMLPKHHYQALELLERGEVSFIEDASHFPHSQNPDAYFKALLGFLM